MILYNNLILTKLTCPSGREKERERERKREKEREREKRTTVVSKESVTVAIKTAELFTWCVVRVVFFDAGQVLGEDSKVWNDGGNRYSKRLQEVEGIA